MALFLLVISIILSYVFSSSIFFWVVWGILFVLQCIGTLVRMVEKAKKPKDIPMPQEYIDMIGDYRITLPSREKK